MIVAGTVVLVPPTLIIDQRLRPATGMAGTRWWLVAVIGVPVQMSV